MYIQFLIVFIVYLFIVFLIGLVASKKSVHNPESTTSTEFILGGRSTHWFLIALSAHASDMSDWLFMGLPAAIYLQGGSQIWIPIGLWCGMFLSWQFIAKPLRIASERYNAMTLASFFKNRFNDTSGMLVGVTSLVSFFFFTIYLSVGLKGVGYVLNSAFHIDYHIGIFVAMLVISAYTIAGGFIAVTWTDLFQGLFLLLMLMLVPIYAFFRVDGFEAIKLAAHNRNISLALFPDFSFETIMSLFLNPFSWCLGYFGMPHILTKFMGAQDSEQLYKAKYVGLTWQFLATAAAVAVGIIGLAYFPGGVPGKPELIFIEMAKNLFNPWLAGTVLCAILAATISTVDSQLLVLASTVAQDFYKNIFFSHASSLQVLFVYRIALMLGACMGFLIAWNEESSIMTLVQYAWSGLGASFGPLIILSLYSNRINKYGAFAGILTGGITSALWNFINASITNTVIYSIVPGFITSILVIYLVSYFTKGFFNAKTVQRFGSTSR